MNWEQCQRKIEECRQCDEERVPFLKVPVSKRHPPLALHDCIKILFVGVAPPWGGDYFWDESRPDSLREGLLRALSAVTGRQINSVSSFYESGYFFVPGVKCPSEKDDKDFRPHLQAIRNCAVHLKHELEACCPNRVLALGRSPMKSLAIALGLSVPGKVRDFRRNVWLSTIEGRLVPVGGTFFPGNNRHRGFDLVIKDIEWFLKQ